MQAENDIQLLKTQWVHPWGGGEAWERDTPMVALQSSPKGCTCLWQPQPSPYARGMVACQPPPSSGWEAAIDSMV